MVKMILLLALLPTAYCALKTLKEQDAQFDSRREGQEDLKKLKMMKSTIEEEVLHSHSDQAHIKKSFYKRE